MSAEDCRHQSQRRDKQFRVRTKFKRSGDPVKDWIALTTLRRWQGFLEATAPAGEDSPAADEAAKGGPVEEDARSQSHHG